MTEMELVKNHSDLIWTIANLLRGPYRPPQYRRVMIPLVVLRRLDCVLEETKAEVLKAYNKLKGFSRANLMYMRSFAENWPDFEKDPIVQQAVGQIPWGHNLVLISKLKDRDERISYANLCLENGWSRNVLVHQIETRLLERQGGAANNSSRARCRNRNPNW